MARTAGSGIQSFGKIRENGVDRIRITNTEPAGAAVQEFKDFGAAAPFISVRRFLPFHTPPFGVVDSRMMSSDCSLICWAAESGFWIRSISSSAAV